MRDSGHFTPRFAGLDAMKHGFLGVALGLISSCVTDPTESQVDQDLGFAPAQVVMDTKVDLSDEPTGTVCSTGAIRCFAHVRTHETGEVRAFAAPNGYGPTDLAAAYAIPTTLATTPTVAIVDAYGYTAIESDLAM